MRTNGMRHVQLLNASPPKIGARGNDDNQRRQHNAEGGRGLQPAGTAAAFVRDVVGEAERALPLYDKSLSICFWWVVVKNRWRPGEHL